VIYQDTLIEKPSVSDGWICMIEGLKFVKDCEM